MRIHCYFSVKHNGLNELVLKYFELGWFVLCVMVWQNLSVLLVVA